MDIPDGVRIPAAPLSLDARPGEEVVAVGFPEGQRTLECVEGLIFDRHTVRTVSFTDDTMLEVLQIDTRGRRGFWGDREVRGGMSGGPILGKKTGTVVAVVEGKLPRGSLRHAPPDGYGIELTHLVICSSALGEHIRIDDLGNREDTSSGPSSTLLKTISEGVTSQLERFSNDAVYQEWRKALRDEIFRALTSFAPEEAMPLLVGRVNVARSRIEEEIQLEQAKLKVPRGAQLDGSEALQTIFGQMNAIAIYNKKRLKGILDDALTVIDSFKKTHGNPQRALNQIFNLFAD
jgi:hypothetical protein